MSNTVCIYIIKCLQFQKVLKLIPPPKNPLKIEIVFSIPRSRLSMFEEKLMKYFDTMREILYNSFQLLVTNQMIFFQRQVCHCQFYKILSAFAVISNCNDISTRRACHTYVYWYSRLHNPNENNISNLSL